MAIVLPDTPLRILSRPLVRTALPEQRERISLLRVAASHLTLLPAGALRIPSDLARTELGIAMGAETVIMIAITTVAALATPDTELDPRTFRSTTAGR
jgi:hypothetical protein